MHIGALHNPTTGIRIHHKVLTELLRWVHSDASSDLANFGCAE
jgi:hypothetical protein